ncbi:MAG: hypothetical protein C6Y22_27225 [Hapalosiphonaceae cyanobacterium JJU2]|nr:MAG: hypothetical protein C6Y22_27225 [Hapalosiphonaceae cyanobacterium JJU2]
MKPLFKYLRAIAIHPQYGIADSQLATRQNARWKYAKHGWLRLGLDLLLIAGTVSLPLGIINPQKAYAAGCSAGTITRISSPVLYIDTGVSPSPVGNYVGYTIKNTSGSAYSDLWVKLGNFTGSRISLATSEDGIMHVGPLASGASKTVFFYLSTSGTGSTSTSESHTVSLYSTRPDLAGSSLCGDPFSLTVEETIKAVANKINTVVTGPNPPELGGIMTITATGDTGTIGAAGIFAPTPASFANWPANAYQLVGTQITMSGGNSGTFNDILYKSGLNGPTTNYTIIYTFVATGMTSTPTGISPVTQISSGTQIKHNDTGAFSSLTPIQPTLNKTTLSKSVSATTLPTGGTVTYTITLNNIGSSSVTLDDIVDVLPSTPGTVTYIPGSAKFNGNAIANPNISGQTLTFLGLFTVPAGGTSTLTYQATVPNTVGTYTNSAVGHIGSTQIDTTTNTSDNAPATANVSVGTPANLTVTKTTNTPNVTVGNTANYTITVTNAAGAGNATNVNISDALPSGFTYASTGSVTLNGGATQTTVTNPTAGATNPSWGTFSIPAGGSVTIPFTVNVGSSVTAGTYQNPATATYTDPSGSSGTANYNSASSTGEDVTVVSFPDLTVIKSDGGNNFTAGSTGNYSITVNNTGTAATSGTITFTDILPTGLSVPNGAVSLTGTNAVNWTCSASNNTITCTSNTVIAASGSSNFSFNVNVASNAPSSVTNTASVSGGSEPVANNGNNTGNDTTTIISSAASNPNVLLVKRITAINESSFTDFIDGVNNNNSPNYVPTPRDTDDNNSNWQSNYLQGLINGGTVRPNDEVEYTVYFLSAGDATAPKVLMCDRIPNNVTFIPTTFNSFPTKNSTGLEKADRGILWQYSGNTESLSNIKDGDIAQYFSPGEDPTDVYPTVDCGGANTNGAIVVNLGDLPNATAPGTPTDSYGFIRFRGRVK